MFFGNYEMFINMQLKLTCRSFRRTSNDSSEEQPKLPGSDTVAKERASEEYKENDRSTSRDEYHLGHKK